MLSYISIDETLIICCILSGAVGFWIGVVVNGYKAHVDPTADTIIYASPRDAYDYGKTRVHGE